MELRLLRRVCVNRASISATRLQSPTYTPFGLPKGFFVYGLVASREGDTFFSVAKRQADYAGY